MIFGPRFYARQNICYSAYMPRQFRLLTPRLATESTIFVVDSVCLFVTLLQKSILLLCFSMESSHFLAISSP